MVAAGHFDEAPPRLVRPEGHTSQRRRQVVVAGGLDHHAGDRDALPQQRVRQERPRRMADRPTIVRLVVRAVDLEVFALRQAECEDARRGWRARVRGRGEHRQGPTARPSTQHDRRLGGQTQARPRHRENHPVVVAELLRVQRFVRRALDSQECPRAEAHGAVPLRGEGPEHPDGRAEPAAVAACKQDERSTRLRSDRYRDVQVERRPMQRDGNHRLARGDRGHGAGYSVERGTGGRDRGHCRHQHPPPRPVSHGLTWSKDESGPRGSASSRPRHLRNTTTASSGRSPAHTASPAGRRSRGSVRSRGTAPRTVTPGAGAG